VHPDLPIERQGFKYINPCGKQRSILFALPLRRVLCVVGPEKSEPKNVATFPALGFAIQEVAKVKILF